MITTHEKAARIIAETLPSCRGKPVKDAADRILRALQKKRIVPVTMRASAELWTRFHAHTRYLGTVTGHGYRYYYDLAIDTMLAEDDWPVKIITKTISIDGHDITVDIQIAESTRKANNRQMLGAYTIITDAAAEERIPLPEKKTLEEIE